MAVIHHRPSAYLEDAWSDVLHRVAVVCFVLLAIIALYLAFGGRSAGLDAASISFLLPPMLLPVIPLA
jgi:hypothetical protein